MSDFHLAFQKTGVFLIGSINESSLWFVMLVLGQEDPKGPAMTLHTVGTQW